MTAERPPYRPDILLSGVIRPTIAALGYDPNPDLDALLVRTCAQESGLGKYRVQIGGGPALGIFQVEPATCTDTWANYLFYRPNTKAKVSAILGDGDRIQALIDNDAYSCAMAIIKYRRTPFEIPPASDIPAQAAYYKKIYNTAGGAATEAEFIATAQALENAPPSLPPQSVPNS